MRCRDLPFLDSGEDSDSADEEALSYTNYSKVSKEITLDKFLKTPIIMS